VARLRFTVLWSLGLRRRIVSATWEGAAAPLRGAHCRRKSIGTFLKNRAGIRGRVCGSWGSPATGAPGCWMEPEKNDPGAVFRP